MSVEIRTFNDEDIDFALAQTEREGWDNTASTFRVCLAHDPEGCFIVKADGQRAGMITTTCYARSAWVGNLILVPHHRRQGIGQRLMEHAIGQLETRNIRTFWLEADPMGVGLYRRLGFVDQFESPRFSKQPPHAAGPCPAQRLRAADLEAAEVLDAKCFGDDRGRLLGEFMGTAHAVYCVRANGRIEGFAMALPSAAGVRFGPCVAENPHAVEKLIDSVLADFLDKTIIVAVPCINKTATQLLESRGFARGPSCLRMLRGKAQGASDPDGLVALANGAMG